MRHWFATNSGVATTAADGYETFPTEDRLEPSDPGFNYSWTGLQTAPLTVAAWPVVMPFGFDIAGAAPCTVWLSQPTADAGSQYLALTEPAVSSFLISFTATGLAVAGSATISTTAMMRKIFRRCYLYIQETATGDWRYVDLESFMVSRGNFPSDIG